MRGIVHLKHHLPRRRRQNWTIDRKCKLSTQWRSKIFANVQPMIGLLLIEVLPQIRRHGLDDSEQIINQRDGILHHESGHNISIRRDVFQRAHRSGRRQPRRDAALRLVKREDGARMRFAVAVFLIEHEVFQIQNADLLQSTFMFFRVRALRALRLCLRYHTFKIGGHDEAGAFLIDLSHARMEWSSSETARSAFLHERGQILEFLQVWTRRKQIVLDPDVKLLVLLLVRDGCCRSSQRIINKLNLRFGARA